MGSPASSTQHIPTCPLPPPAEFSDNAVSANTATTISSPGSDFHVDVQKGSSGVGIGIVGGTDTPLGCVLVHEIYPNGAAMTTGKLRPGDQILEVNGRSLREATHSEALEALRQSVSSLQLLLHRDQPTSKDETLPLQEIEIEISKKAGRGLGLSIVGMFNSHGVYISEVIKGGLADIDGRFVEGDQILRVNELDLSQVSQEFAAAVLKTTYGKMNITLGRFHPGGCQK